MSTASNSAYPHPGSKAFVLKERGIEDGFIEKLRNLKYTFRTDQGCSGSGRGVFGVRP